MTVFTNDGKGSFSSAAVVPIGVTSFGAGNYPNFVTAADLTGDGHLDLIESDFGSATLTEITQINTGPPPLVSLTAPVSGAAFLTTATMTLKAAAQPAKGVKSIREVDYYLDGRTLLGTNGAAPYVLQVALANMATGSHTLQAGWRWIQWATARNRRWFTSR